MMKMKRAAQRSADIRRLPLLFATRSARSLSTLTSRLRPSIPPCAHWPRTLLATNGSTPQSCVAIAAAPFAPSGRPLQRFQETSKCCARPRDNGMAQPRQHAALAKALDDVGESADASVFRRLAAEEEKTAAGAIGPALPKLRNAADGLRVLEEAFDRFALIGERSKDERVVAEAQRLSGAM